MTVQKQGNQLKASQNPFVLMPILLLMWGSLAAISKLLLQHLDSYQLLFYMYGIGVIVFFIIVLYKVQLRVMLSWKRREWLLLVSCGVLTFLYDFFYLKSLELIPAVEASMLNYLFPIFIVLLAVPIHKEPLHSSKLLSVGMGFIGTLLLVTKGDLSNVAFTNLEGDLLAILAAVSWGLFTNLIKKNHTDLLLSTFFLTFVAFLLSALALLVSSRFTIPQGIELYGVIWLSLSNIILGFFLYFRALQYSSASLIASFTFFTPFVTLMFIVLLLGERLTWTDALAALLIIGCVPLQKLGEATTGSKRPMPKTAEGP
ncbi:DMT family transporter [Paenibacillus sp. GD4]|uniref:DMT family transporter n=1 Tax=Paenibacillus sp. GD4 TaxID=3068890 RepID=UPI002796D4DB|nr:DMT family transporter [Paenibacillus sp. GD4]MDQ1911058.1 DMT family transporter [Paenibacillus sp. GD4]